MKIGFLKKRAEDFLAGAKFHFKEGNYNIAAFDLDQVCQLYLKYYLYLKIKRYPKTHSLEELLLGVGKVYKKEKEIEKILSENVNLIGDLNQAYLTARYLPVEFSKKQIENMLKFTQNLIQFSKNL